MVACIVTKNNLVRCIKVISDVQAVKDTFDDLEADRGSSSCQTLAVDLGFTNCKIIFDYRKLRQKRRFTCALIIEHLDCKV